MTELTERRKEILAIVIREYVATAVPVGSTTIAEKHGLNVSPATIRNEMAVLEEAGYLTHPHTSAGRMPTAKGYRYFVEQLMADGRLGSAERRLIRGQFDAAAWDPDAWMRLSASVLAQVARSASLVTAPRAGRCHFRHMDLVALRDDLVLLVLVLADGSVEQARFTPAEPRTQEEWSAVADRLNRRLANLDHQEIARLDWPPIAPIPDVVDAVVGLMAEVDRRYAGGLIHAGLEHVVTQPEFADSERVAEFLHVFEHGDFLVPILSDIAWRRRGVQIIIAGEDRWEIMSEYGLVLADYGAGSTRGALGVLGPMRMPYERAVSAVRYVSDLMSRLVRELYGVT
jgi:heat-inducible transcriptional repressor